MKVLGLLLGLASFSVLASDYVVELKPGFKVQDLQRIQAYSGVQKLEKFTDYRSQYFDRLYSLELSDDKVLNKIKSDKSIALVESDFTPEYFEIRINPNSKMVTNDMLLPQQWGLFNQDQIIEKRSLSGKKLYVYAKPGVDINWHESIDKIESGLKRRPIVAVVDMGIDLAHPELVDSIYKNTKECDEAGSVPVAREDLDGNKLPADCHGWNFAATDPNYQNFPIDDKGHGTHVSGIIAAKRNNETGIGGVSDKIQILPIRVTGAVDENPNERAKLLIKAPSKRIANGILYAVRMGADVINLSLGWPKSMDTNFMRQVIAEAISNNIVVVAAAGNDNSSANIYPCSYYDVICVGSVDINGEVSSFSNHGGQVDVLAPGDQIVSTIPTSFIPLKLNIQGYDILSGTSQAAPFVSAQAALLKGSYSDISLDEIKRRIFSTTQARLNPEKSIGGLIDLSKSYGDIAGPFIQPVFKELKAIEVDPKTGIFQFPIYLKNYGDNTEDVKATLNSLNPAVKILAANPATKLYEKSKPAPLYVTGKVLDFSGDRNLQLELELNVAGTSQKYYHSLILGLNLEAVPKMNFGFKFLEGIKPVMIKDKETGKYRALLDTIDEEYEGETLPSYYLIKKTDTEEEKSVTIDMFHFDGRGFHEARNSFKLDNALKFLSITKHDYNYDGKKDILVKTIVCRKDCHREKIPEKDLYILFSYRDLDFEPLLGEYSDIEFTTPEGINITPKTVRHYKMQLPNGQFVAAPYFVTEGVEPDHNSENNSVRPVVEDDVKFEHSSFEDDFLFNMFKPTQKRILRQVYFLALDAAKKAFVPKTYMGDKFDLVVRTKMGQILNKRVAVSDTFTNVVQLMHQSKDDFYQDKIHVMYSFGLGGYQYNFILEIHNGEYRIIPATDIDRPLLGNSHYKFFNLHEKTEKDSGDTFVNFLTTNLITVTGVNANNEPVILPYRLDRDDVIMGFLGMYETKTKRSMFLEQVDTISLITEENGKMHTSFSPTEKFSFLAGSTMTDLYFPVVIQDRESSELAPAIYVDNTAISSNQVYLSTEVNEKLIAPIRSSLYIPETCNARTPILGKDGSYLFAFICQDENGFRLKYINMIK